MKQERKAPKAGYNFAAKAKYRENIWSCFAKNVKNVSITKVLFLPSKEGLEIPIALRHGFKEENLIAVDENPAMIATSKWRKEYPKIKFYGNTLIRASSRMKKDNVHLDAANLDLCGTISSGMLDTVHTIIKSGILADSALLAVTTVKGRETTDINALLQLLARAKGVNNTCDMSRARTLIAMALTDVKDRLLKDDLLTGEYRTSGSMYMQYAVNRIVKATEDEVLKVTNYKKWRANTCIAKDIASRRFNKKQEVEIVKMYMGGKNSSQIAKVMQASKTTIAKVLKYRGVEMVGYQGRSGKKLSLPQETQLVMRYVEGENNTQLIKDYNIAISTLRLIVIRHGIKPRSFREARQKFTTKQEIEIAKRYAELKDICQLASIYNVSESTIRTVLKRQGVKMRSRSEAQIARQARINKIELDNK